MKLTNLIPMLNVADIDASLEFYQQAGGFAVVSDPQVDTNWPAVFYFYPDDVVGLYAHVIAEGFEPTPLTVTIYGMREFSLIDPNGHVLSFGQDAEQSG